MKAVAFALVAFASITASANNNPDVSCTDLQGNVYNFIHDIDVLEYVPVNGVPGAEVDVRESVTTNDGVDTYEYESANGSTVVVLSFGEGENTGSGRLAYGTELNCTRK